MNLMTVGVSQRNGIFTSALSTRKLEKMDSYNIRISGPEMNFQIGAPMTTEGVSSGASFSRANSSQSEFTNWI